MGTPFPFPVVGGGGALVLPSIHSPNFTASPLTGWSVDQDGNAFFASITLPTGATVQVYYQGTAPTGSIHTGSLWFDTAGGYQISRWDGSSWVAITQDAASVLEPGTITASLLVAGIVVAGIVDGTTITGAQFIAHGSSGEFLAYSGTPALGNLVASVSPAAGTDSDGNAYLGPGTASYVLHAGTYFAALNTGGAIIFYESSGGAGGPYVQLGSIAPGGQSARGSGAGPEDLLLIPGSSGQVIATAAVVAEQPGTSDGTPETWNSLGTLAGYTVSKGRYRMTPDGELELDIQVTAGGSNAASVSFSTLLSSPYVPLVSYRLPLQPSGGAYPATPCNVLVNASTGAVTIGQSASNTLTLSNVVRVPLD